jgi:hypothetical protein
MTQADDAEDAMLELFPGARLTMSAAGVALLLDVDLARLRLVAAAYNESVLGLVQRFAFNDEETGPLDTEERWNELHALTERSDESLAKECVRWALFDYGEFWADPHSDESLDTLARNWSPDESSEVRALFAEGIEAARSLQFARARELLEQCAKLAGWENMYAEIDKRTEPEEPPKG